MPVSSDSASGVSPAASARNRSRSRSGLRLAQRARAAPRARLGRRRLGSTPSPRLERAPALEQRLGERAADRHHLAHRLHARAEPRVGDAELLERPARDLDHAVVERGLEAGRASCVVMSFGISSSVSPTASIAEILAIGNPVALLAQRRAARDARVHLDDAHLAGVGVHRELDVGAARLDLDRAHHAQRRVAHVLVAAVATASAPAPP